MNHQVPNRKLKKFLLPLIILALTAAGCHQNSSAEQLESVPSQETIAESVLETDFIAAASVQTELTDVISESVIESESVPFIVTETAPQENIPVASEQLTSPETAVETTASETSTAEETSTETEITTAVSSESSSSESSTETITELSAESVELKLTFHDVLDSIFRCQSFQEDVFAISDKSSVSENEFAVLDIDNDGLNELIIRWSNTDTNSIAGIVYSYDTDGNICRELLTTPYLRFYSNGMIEADVSINPALSRDFPPYVLYQYDAASNSYQEIALVEIWEKSYCEINPHTGELFPDYLDSDHSGFVYYTHPTSENKDYSSPKSAAEYAEWHNFYADSVLDIPFRKFTEENINQVQ